MILSGPDFDPDSHTHLSYLVFPPWVNVWIIKKYNNFIYFFGGTHFLHHCTGTSYQH